MWDRRTKYLNGGGLKMDTWTFELIWNKPLGYQIKLGQCRAHLNDKQVWTVNKVSDGIIVETYDFDNVIELLDFMRSQRVPDGDLYNRS